MVITDDPPSVVSAANTPVWVGTGLAFAAINGLLIAQLFRSAGRSGSSGTTVGILVVSLLIGLVAAWWLPRFVGQANFRVDESTFSYQPMRGTRVEVPISQLAKLEASYGRPEVPGSKASLSFREGSGSQRVLLDHSSKLVVDAVMWFRPDLPTEPFVPHPADRAKVYHAWREMLVLLLPTLWLMFLVINVLPYLTS